MSHFDVVARTWDADPQKVERARRVADAIAKRLPALSRMSVFEYGSGTGLLGFELQPHVASLTMADSSREMTAVAREKILAKGASNATALELDLTAAPPPPDRYDVVCTLLTLHHVDDVQALLRTFHAMLAPGGFLCVSDLDEEDGSFHGPGAHVHHGFPRATLASWIREAGFGEVELSTVGEIDKVTAAGPRRYPLFLAIAQRAGAPAVGAASND